MSMRIVVLLPMLRRRICWAEFGPSDFSSPSTWAQSELRLMPRSRIALDQSLQFTYCGKLAGRMPCRTDWAWGARRKMNKRAGAGTEFGMRRLGQGLDIDAVALDVAIE